MQTKLDLNAQTQSRTIARKLLYRKFNTDIYGEGQTLFTILNKGKKSSDQNQGFDKLEKLLIIKLRNMIDVKEDKITGILTAPAKKIMSILLAPGSKIAILAHAKSKKN